MLDIYISPYSDISTRIAEFLSTILGLIHLLPHLAFHRYPGIYSIMAKLNRAALGKIAVSFRALSEPTRLAILQELKSGPMTVNEIVEAIALSQANVSKQLSILRDAGFLVREQRGTQAYYSIGDEMVMQLCALVCGRLNRQALARVEKLEL